MRENYSNWIFCAIWANSQLSLFLFSSFRKWNGDYFHTQLTLEASIFVPHEKNVYFCYEFTFLILAHADENKITLFVFVDERRADVCRKSSFILRDWFLFCYYCCTMISRRRSKSDESETSRRTLAISFTLAARASWVSRRGLNENDFWRSEKVSMRKLWKLMRQRWSLFHSFDHEVASSERNEEANLLFITAAEHESDIIDFLLDTAQKSRFLWFQLSHCINFSSGS